MVATMVAKRWPIGLLSFGVLALALAIVLPMTVFAAGDPSAGISINAVDSGDTGDILIVRVNVSAADLGGTNAGDGVLATGTATYRAKAARTTTTVDINCVATNDDVIHLLSGGCSGQSHVTIDLGTSAVEIETVGTTLPNTLFDPDDSDKITLGIAVRSSR